MLSVILCLDFFRVTFFSNINLALYYSRISDLMDTLMPEEDS